MKKLLITLVICALPMLVVAEDNPDSRPSVALSVGGYSSSGNYSIQGFLQDQSGSAGWFNVTLTYPVSPDVTIWFSGGYQDAKNKGEKTILFFKSTSNWTYLSGTFGIKFYFGESVNK